MKIRYNNLYTHFILITRDRFPSIFAIHRIRIEKYITGIVNQNGCKMYAIYANPDHVHFLVSRDPSMSESALVELITKGSERFINTNNLCKGRFYWQTSCAAFSVSKRDVDKVYKYILDQPEHHKRQTSTEEIEAFVRFYNKPSLGEGNKGERDLS